MKGTDPKTVLYETFARVGKAALGNPARIELLNLLAQGERGVEELAGASGLKLSNTSAQLKVLAGAGLVTSRRAGTSVRYRVADPRVTGLVELAKRLAIDRAPRARDAARDWMGDMDALEPVTREELARRLDEGGVLVLDVRPGAEFAAGHIEGAVNVPLSDLPERLGDLPRDTQIVAYCRGQFCAMSPEAARILRQEGYRARVLDGGLPEWRDEGLPVAVG
ncbi:MAG: metalloregulator ArsR/SmtB family transcription factor [Streptosporangiales bacterium]|nr:metalloregulator ArsR/SmtB family transcription factor [Streptosporangiales bacterium]